MVKEGWRGNRDRKKFLAERIECGKSGAEPQWSEELKNSSLPGAKRVYRPGSRKKIETTLVVLTERTRNCFTSIRQQERVTAESRGP